MNTFTLTTLTILCLLLHGCGCENGPTETIQISGETFVLEVASDEAAIARGLGGRERLGANEGMIFVFPNNQPRRFWMKDCLIDIDIMFLDPLGRITAIHQMKAEPARGPEESQAAYEQRLARYPSTMGALYAIELSGGRIRELGLEPGNKLVIPHDCLKQRLE
ncbi:MAG: DUF192 domain-containing protein [Planctomycetota bacterium]|nr:DUF192 domain-containing protein [Planctomycetota bacterium]